MSVLRLHIGYDGTTDALRKLAHAGLPLAVAYTGAPLDLVGGGRLQGIASLRLLKEQGRLAQSAGLRLAVTMNAPVISDYSTRKPVLLDAARACIDAGVTGITVADPRLIDDLAALPIEVTASTILGIDSAASLKAFMAHQFDCLVPSYSCNRDLSTLREMRDLLAPSGRRLMLIVDELCSVPCPYRSLHFTAQGMQDRTLSDYFVQRCDSRFASNPHLLLANSIIPPQVLDRYSDVCVDFKLATRMVPIDTTIRVARMYASRRMYGNYFDIAHKNPGGFYLDADDVADLVGIWPTCRNNCGDCQRCFLVTIRRGQGLQHTPSGLAGGEYSCTT